MKIYAAYGNKVNPRVMRKYCPNAMYVGRGFLQGYQMIFESSERGCAAVVKMRFGGRVPVVLWAVEDEDEAALNLAEGYPYDAVRRMSRIANIDWSIEWVDNLSKGKVPDAHVFLGSLLGTECDAMIYINMAGDACSPSDEYLREMEEGYAAAPFSPRYLSEALRKTARMGG